MKQHAVMGGPQPAVLHWQGVDWLVNLNLHGLQARDRGMLS